MLLRKQQETNKLYCASLIVNTVDGLVFTMEHCWVQNEEALHQIFLPIPNLCFYSIFFYFQQM